MADVLDRLFAPCPRGLESVLADELRALDAQIDEVAAGGVAFSGDRALMYRANLLARIPSRILLRVAQHAYRNEDDLYRLAADVDWERWFEPAHRLRVDVTATRSPLRSLNFATLRIKDAIVDRMRARAGDRPSIDTRSPDVRVFAYLGAADAALYVDTSGEPLFKRGWRRDKGEAPLKENLAAGLLMLAGWTPQQPLYDPFCGSGTIVIEAAQIAAGIPPGAQRRFGFERLLGHDAQAWERTRADAMRGAAAAGAPIAASDAAEREVAQARINAKRAGLAESAIRLSVADALRAPPPFEPPAMIVTNPPYGERSRIDADRDQQAAIERWGMALKHRYGGWTVAVLSSDLQLARRLGIKALQRTPLYNGPIECRLFSARILPPFASRSAT